MRWDALTLNLLWVIPYAYPFIEPFSYVWLLALLLVFISSGWAAGDVSLSAFIQASLSERKAGKKGNFSPLGAVMAFLYAAYIASYALLSYGLGKAFDYHYSLGEPRVGFFYLAGVMMSIASVIIFAATFIPKGTAKFNPSYEDLGIEEAAGEAAAAIPEHLTDLETPTTSDNNTTTNSTEKKEEKEKEEEEKSTSQEVASSSDSGTESGSTTSPADRTT